MYLTLDQGGTSSRAIVFAPDGAVVARAQVGVSTRRASGGIVEQDPDELVASLKRCIEEVARTVTPDRWSAVGLACQRSSVVGWDAATGAARTPVLSWMDTRAAAAFDDLKLDPARVRALTGLRSSAHYGATKLRWMLETMDTRGAFRCGPLASFLLARLLDDRPCIASHTLAQRTLLYDVAARDWSDELLRAFGIPRDVLPAPVDDCGAHGTLRGAPFTVCAGDQNVVPFATGGPDAGTAYVNLGTGAFVLRPVADPDAVPPGLLLAPLDGPPGRRSLAAEGTVNGAGSAIAWFERESGAEMPWQAMASVDPETAPLFVNSVGDLGSPFWRTGLEPRFEPDSGDAAARAYAVVESIAFLVRANLERIAAAARVQRVVATGGLAQAPAMRATLARVLRLPVDYGPPEATARGVAALLGCVVSPSAAARDDAASGDDPAAPVAGRYARWYSSLPPPDNQ